MEEQETILDSGKRLSASKLWELQHTLYSHHGPQAWIRAGVPSYMTSNPYTARQYAAMALGYIRDCLSGIQGVSLKLTEPFYIFDLGAGTGRFGYLFLRELRKNLRHSPFDQINIRYIMTDMIDGNLEYLRHHPYLQEMIEKGILDFAHYHTNFKDESLKLLVSGNILKPEAIVNPAIVIGNYFFDVIPQDVFKVVDGKLCEGLLTLFAKGKVDPHHLDPELLNGLRAEYHYKSIDSSRAYYEDEIQENLLKVYAASCREVPFTIPVAALQTLKYFKKLSNKRMFLLAGDQAVSTEDLIKRGGDPLVVLQGGISMSVNYHAIAKSINMQGGAAWLTTYPDPLFLVIAAAFGGKETDHPETTLAFENSLEYFQPSDYWKLACYSEETEKVPSIESLLLLVKLGNWDPINFHAFFPQIRAQMRHASPDTCAMLVATIRHVWDAFYPVCQEEANFMMNLGVLLFEMHLPDDALLYFNRALAWGGENPLIHQNIAACQLVVRKKQQKGQSLV